MIYYWETVKWWSDNTPHAVSMNGSINGCAMCCVMTLFLPRPLLRDHIGAAVWGRQAEPGRRAGAAAAAVAAVPAPIVSALRAPCRPLAAVSHSAVPAALTNRPDYGSDGIVPPGREGRRGAAAV